ncbi:MAG: FAD-binding oxidoreductase [Acidobacteria bacterium]|nr:FAD-binding oxidoreductase [Acidobacteriota bacterium]
MNFDVAIIGAGIVGAACAASLAREGLSVVVIDGVGPASGATAAAMGHIVAMDDSEAQFALTSYSQKLWNSLADEMPERSEYERCGTIWIADDDAEIGEARRKREFYQQRGVASELLDERSLRETEPNLRPGLSGGLLVGGDSVVYQPFAAKFLLDRAAVSGARAIYGKRVVGIDRDGVRLDDSTKILAAKTVVAAGCESNDLIDGLRIRRKKGHLLITDRYPGFVRHQLVELGYLKSAHAIETDSVAFNVQPRITGQVLVGSSRQYDVDDREIDFAIVKKMMSRASLYLPGIARLSALRVWTGFRPATEDNLPLIGRHPRIDGVYLATGHEGLGITTSLGTAELITDEILGRESAIDRAPYSPERGWSAGGARVERGHPARKKH